MKTRAVLAVSTVLLFLTLMAALPMGCTHNSDVLHQTVLSGASQSLDAGPTRSSETVVYSEGFENSNGGYTTAGPLNQWQWGTPTNPNGPGSAHSGARCWVTNLTGNVPLNSSSYLTSPPVLLPSTISAEVLRVRFYAWIAIDETFDRGEFQVSSDGASFVTLVELFHTMQGDWSAYDFDITDHAGGPIYLRFLLYADGVNNFYQSTPNMAGLYIDDVKITLYLSPTDKTTLTLEAHEEQYWEASCPWVFSWNGSGFIQDNDIYPTARGIDQEYTDYYRLNVPLVPLDDEYLLELREMTKETSYTDQVKLVAVYHSADVKVAPDENGSIWTYSDPLTPVTAIDGEGNDVSIELANEDSLVYKAYNDDTVTLDFSNVDTSDGATLVLQAAGFRDDGDSGTATGGSPRIFIQTQDASQNWISRHYFYPRNNLCTQAFDLTPYLTDNRLVRLYVTSCHTGKYFEIDYVGLDNNPQADATTYSLSPFSAVHSINGDILSKIVSSDREYASMSPGETMSLSFPVPGMMNEIVDFVLVTRGYYLPSGTYFVSTWDGTAWVERDGWSILGTGDQNRTFDMSLFLPDPDGQFKVRIWQDFWYWSAGIDCVSLTHAGAAATIDLAFDLQKSLDVTSLLNASDNIRDEWVKDSPYSYWHNGQRNRWVEVTFTTQDPQNTPPTTNPITVTDLTSVTPTISWTYADTDSDIQTMYEVEVWTFQEGTGNIMWDPALGTGTEQSIVYAGLELALGQTYYARVKAFDGKDWGQWSETSLALTQGPVVSARALVVRGMDDRIYYRTWNGTDWEEWTVLPGSTCDSPATAMLGNQLHVVVRGSDGNSLWYGYLTNITDPGSFAGWTLLDGATSSAPTLTSNGTALCLVVRGLDNRIYCRYYTGSWGAWHAVPTGATCDSPAASMLGNDLHVVVRGMDESSLWDIIVSCDGSVVRDWSVLSGATPSRPVLACSSSDNLCLVVRGMDNAIYYRNYTGSTDIWADWNAFPTGATNDGPGATVVDNELCMLVRGMDGDSLWCGDVDLGTSSFTGWTLLDGATPSAPTLTS